MKRHFMEDSPQTVNEKMLDIISHQGMQIKTQIRYHCKPIKMAKIKAVATPNAGVNFEKLDHLDIIGENLTLYSPSGKQF